MTMNEIVFRIERQSSQGRVFREFPEAIVSQWCNNGDRDVFEISVDQGASVEEYEKRIESIPDVLLYHIDLNDGVILLVKKCDCYEPGAIARLITESNCLLMPPTVYHKEWGHYKVVSFTPEGEVRLYDTLEERTKLEILSKTRIVNAGTGGGIRVSILSLFSRMTNKQLNALMAAYENGYYRSPRGITTERLAELIGVTRPTYEEHMRKAENKIISAIASYLRLLYYREPSKSPGENSLDMI